LQEGLLTSALQQDSIGDQNFKRHSDSVTVSVFMLGGKHK